MIVCKHCDLILKETPVESGGKAACVRCGLVLYRLEPQGLERSLIFALTAGILFILANSFPIVTISSQGLTNSTTLLSAAYRLISDGIPSIAILVFITTFLMPAIEISAFLYLLLLLSLGHVPPGFSFAFRVIHLVKPWAMIEVFMLGLLVTIAKLNAFATVTPDIGLISFILLMLAMTAAAANFDPHQAWIKLAQVKKLKDRAC